jgi:SAM-dependent methyltransferase
VEVVGNLDLARARRDYEELTRRFNERTAGGRYGDVTDFYWYHTIDLGDGLVTPGAYDYRDVIDAFLFPADMSGMKVLDVGSATGFFTFEFEKRGAEVTSVELPSLADWDILSCDREAAYGVIMRFHRQTTLVGAYNAHLEGPFQFCHRILGSKAKRCYSRIYDLSPEKFGGETFDLVFVSDVLQHTFSPLKAMDALWTVCRGTLVLAQWVPKYPPDVPAMLYIGGDGHGGGGDGRSWWLVNLAALEQMLRRVGFDEIAAIGRHRGIDRSFGIEFDRVVYHAAR